MQAVSETLSVRGESLVSEYLSDRGFEILDRNFRVRGGEIDIVARRADLVLFVEVKTRSSLRMGSGAEAVTAAKLARILRAAKVYQAQHAGCGRRFRFDVADVLWEAGRPPSIRYIENVYREE
jgi:putative endonuclease